MKRLNKKLTIRSESIRVLSGSEVSAVHGGVQNTILGMCPDTFGCGTPTGIGCYSANVITGCPAPQP